MQWRTHQPHQTHKWTLRRLNCRGMQNNNSLVKEKEKQGNKSQILTFQTRLNPCPCSYYFRAVRLNVDLPGADGARIPPQSKRT